MVSSQSESLRKIKVGDEFIYTTPSGREIFYTVDALKAETPQGQFLPRARSEFGQVVFIHDELLAQDWWEPTVALRALPGAAG